MSLPAQNALREFYNKLSIGMTLKLTDHDFSGAVRTIPAKERRNRGVFPSKKVKDGVVEYESQIERDFFLLLEHDDHVAQYQLSI